MTHIVFLLDGAGLGNWGEEGQIPAQVHGGRRRLSVHICMGVCAQSCPALHDPVDYSPPGSSVHEILQNTEAGCHFLLQGIFPTQGSNSHLRCLLYWGVDSLPLALPQAPSYVHNSAQITRTRDFTVETKPTLFMLQHPSLERQQEAAGCLCHQRHDQSHSYNQYITEEWNKGISKRCKESYKFCQVLKRLRVRQCP